MATYPHETTFQRQQQVYQRTWARNLPTAPLQPYLDARQNQREDSRQVPERVIPEGQYFMLGDNRDNSQDSRYFGYVPRANLIGRAAYVWYARDSGRIGPLH